MKREDVKNKIPGITEEQLNWLMQENGSDITREKNAAAALQTQLDSAQAQLKTAPPTSTRRWRMRSRRTRGRSATPRLPGIPTSGMAVLRTISPASRTAFWLPSAN